ncbi:putative Uncharacterized transposase-like protein [Monocercomonoides exilis]|uniref:putative Uncharacterized transposase-like protein n=1 Tax=Monocercomonoides exilis TaxID=2049356 RepID=UPI00355AC6A0|nr:putative Uncharacterized transposase-like protein [Monocercomonoides exilis]|eukprot:MONOS_5916.1-p1 / transcript=MONOS_5916.1 / gene=MONOS_5916 / organism=Monocercomonoides_exilis_PA203 / gene_product=Uncharacterized transposase-like protein HI1328.1 / transcript_product=Uncharacterized transposase-like protein HI1328.1 / location=Mono_scaffold00178:72272-73048(+) / protein_length=258 / sequence_SO=supercontig / SO=protein_coding / is_pseudo=false
MKIYLGSTLLICLYYWVKIPIKTISSLLKISQKTVGFWCSVERVCCAKEWNDKQQTIGGLGKTVEIDEAVWRKRKFGRGRRKDHVWIFGGVERLEGGGAGKRFMTIVPNRTKKTLIPLIQRFIMPGTTVVSDEWKAYTSLEELGYQHLTVCHKRNFVNSETGACTNTIEGLWSHLRSSFPRFGTRKKYILDHVAMFLAKTSLKLSFEDLMNKIAEYKEEEEKEEENEMKEDEEEEVDEEVPFFEDIIPNEDELLEDDD